MSQSEKLFSPSKVLRYNDGTLAFYLSTLSLQFAVLGYIDVARRLVSLLNSYNKFHDRRHSLRPLWLVWNETGDWPAGEEWQVLKDLKDGTKASGEPPAKSAKLDQKTGEFTKSDIGGAVREQEKSYIAGWDCRASDNAKCDGYKQKRLSDQLSTSEAAQAVREILKGINETDAEYRDANTGSVAMDVSAALTSALDLVLLIEEKDDTSTMDGVPTSEEIIARIAKRLDANSQIEYLAQSRRAWRILRSGALAKEVGVDAKKVETFHQEVEEMVHRRIHDGRLQPPQHSMQKMLELIDNNTRTNREALEYFAECGDEPLESLFRSPASPSEIRDLETSLQIQLPDDYKEFLAITNGLEASWGGIIMEPPLHPASAVRWFDDNEDYFIDLTLDAPDAAFSIGRNAQTDVAEKWPAVGKAIEIGTEDIFNVWLIPPSTVSKIKDRIFGILGNDKYGEDVKMAFRRAAVDFAGDIDKFKDLDWICVTWASGGAVCMVSYSSFGRYLGALADEKDSGILSKWEFFGYHLRETEENETVLP